MKETILITGIKGFLGTNLIGVLKNDYNVIGLDVSEELYKGIKIFSSNQLNDINIQPNIVIVCHAAVASGTTTPDDDTLYEVNVKLTKRILDKFFNSKIIYISTASIYSKDLKVIKESSEIYPQSNYAISKLWAEQIIIKQSVILRLSSLYGIGMKENTIIPNYVNQAIKNKKIEVWGKGYRKQNYIHVLDVCNAIKASIKAYDNVKGKFFLIVNDKEYSNIELANIIAEQLNSNISFVYEDNSASLEYNNTYTLETLNWKPNYSFKKEIKRYIEWKIK